MNQVPFALVPACGCGDLVDPAAVRSVLARLIPTWSVFKVSNAVHALRLWGPDAVFDGERHPSPFGKRIFTGRELLGLFLDHRQYRRLVRSGASLMRATDHGVVVTAGSARVNMEGDLIHVDKLLRTCADVNVLPSTFIRTIDAEATVADLVRGSVATFDASQELEWTVEALARYIAPVRGWVNRFGERFTFDDAVAVLTGRTLGRGACLGTHVPYVLCVLLPVDAVTSILKPRFHAAAIDYLRGIRRRLLDHRRENGRWGGDWAPAGEEEVRIVGRDADEPARVTVTAHHLEWAAIAPPVARLPDELIRHASGYLVEFMRRLDDAEVNDYYPVLTHAARALCHFAGIDPLDGFKLLL
ncbi:MAG: hypothetical protein AB7I30_09575 [Isosphaeraceae bacterium]